MGQAKIIDCGGPAFPADEWDQDDSVSQGCIVLTEKHLGMTLRDYFAANAINGMCSTPTWPRADDSPELAKRAYALADAMLAERMR